MLEPRVQLPSLGRRIVRYALQQVIQLLQRRECIFTGVNDCDAEVGGRRGGFLEGGPGFPDVKAGAQGRLSGMEEGFVSRGFLFLLLLLLLL